MPHEHTFNVLLAEAFRARVADWNREGMVRPEERRGGRRPDILIDENGRTMRPLIIESAYGGDGDRDTRDRLNQEEFSHVDTAIALAIPERFRRMSDTETRAALRQPDCRLKYAALQREGDGLVRFPAGGYCTGDVSDLAAFARLSSASRNTIEHAADRAAACIARAAAILRDRLPAPDIKAIGEITRQRQDENAALRTVALLWLDAMLVQAHLRQKDYAPLAKVGNPTRTRNCAAEPLMATWRRILGRQLAFDFRAGD